jgi:hypothetical protein
MLSISVSLISEEKTVCVSCTKQVLQVLPIAVLLGRSGEQLRTFALTEINNELVLDEFAAGNYTLRIEAGNEVCAKQIVLP